MWDGSTVRFVTVSPWCVCVCDIVGMRVNLSLCHHNVCHWECEYVGVPMTAIVTDCPRGVYDCVAVCSPFC